MEESEMLKRILSVLLAVLLLCPAVNGLAGVSARLKQSMATRSGPGTWYTEELGTLPASTSITAIEQITTSETTWVLVEFQTNGRMYRAYTGLWRMQVYGDVPLASAKGYGDTVLSATSAYYGPGTQYATRRTMVSGGTSVTVYSQEGQWAQCEYKENGKSVRAYLPVSALRDTGASSYAPVTSNPYGWYVPVVTSAPNSASTILDYYGNAYNTAGHTQEFLTLVQNLPVMNYFDGIPCAQRSDVYSGPGTQYWRPYTNAGYAYTGTSDTLRVFCQENGWLLIRYPTQKGYRYGWTQLSAIPANLVYWAKEFEHASFQVITTMDTTATDDPDTMSATTMPVSTGVMMTALAFLDESRQWVYCEFTVLDGGAYSSSRGFVPATALRSLSE